MKQTGTLDGIAFLKDSRPVLPGNTAKLKTRNGELGSLSSSEIARIGLKAGVTGVSHANGRQQNAELLFAHVEQIGEAAKAEAINRWLASNT